MSSLPRKLARILTSVPVLTLLVLIGVDVLLRQGNLLDEMGYRTVDVWNLPPRLEACRRDSPDAILIGSSLLLVLNQDAHGGNLYKGGYPRYFQELLTKATGKEVAVMNLCTGLQMVSETYLLTQALAASKDPPAVVIYGTQLRDFIHDPYALEWSCDSFNSLAPYVPLNLEVLSKLTSWQARKEFILCNLWYLYRNRSDFKNFGSAVTKDTLEYLPLDMPYVRLGYNHQYGHFRHGLLWEAWVPRQQEAFTERLYRNNPGFLRKFYREFQASVYVPTGSEDTMKIETYYLEQLIELCQRRNIKLVLVFMPISPEIEALAPPGLYDAFKTFLHDQSDRNHVPLIDIFRDPRYRSEHFKDGVHLNYEGTTMLAEQLAEIISSRHRDVLEAMRAHAARHEAGRKELRANR